MSLLEATTQVHRDMNVKLKMHRSYPTVPVSNLYVFGRVQDLAFEKPTTDEQNCGHIRIWNTGLFILYEFIELSSRSELLRDCSAIGEGIVGRMVPCATCSGTRCVHRSYRRWRNA